MVKNDYRSQGSDPRRLPLVKIGLRPKETTRDPPAPSFIIFSFKMAFQAGKLGGRKTLAERSRLEH
jgi:hypothetical protein